ncbi:MAG: hypothetical protein ACP5OK_02045 [Thermoprotei archaeon]
MSGMEKTGIIGFAFIGVGIVLLLVVFFFAYQSYLSYAIPSGTDMIGAINILLEAGVKALFLGIMAWVGSILLLRGLESFKVEKGIGMVTLKVERGTEVITIPKEALKEETKGKQEK